MLICKVKGNVVMTAKDERLSGWKIMIVQTLDVDGKENGDVFMAVDNAQAGIGDIALVARHGAAARAAMFTVRAADEYAPANAVIIGIIDNVVDYRENSEEGITQIIQGEVADIPVKKKRKASGKSKARKSEAAGGWSAKRKK